MKTIHTVELQLEEAELAAEAEAAELTRLTLFLH